VKRDIRLHLGALVFSAGLLFPTGAPAQSVISSPSPSRVEVWGAFTLVPWAGAGTLESSYEPKVTSAPDASGRLGQTLTLDPARGRGVEFGVNVYASSHVGIQAFVSRTSTHVGGSNPPYEGVLQYISRPPPSGQPVPVALDWAVNWPDTDGCLRQWTAGAGPALRWQGQRAAVVLSTGIVWTRLSGDAAPLGYTTFSLGGHSVLFSQDFRMRASLGPSMQAGGYAAAMLDLVLGPHAAITMGLRTLVANVTELPSTIDAIADATGDVAPFVVADINRQMALEPARLSPRRTGLIIGLKVR